MKIILDTANIKDIKEWHSLIGATHITTNPHLLKKEGIDSQEKFIKFVEEIEATIDSPVIFFQCITKEDVTLLKSLEDRLTKFVAKVTMLPEFYPVIKKAQKLNVPTAATTCYDLIQIHQACEFDMDYSMVYFAKNENGFLLTEAVEMYNSYDYKTGLVAASFRTKRDVMLAIKSGIEFATVPPSVLEEVYKNNDVDADVVKIVSSK